MNTVEIEGTALDLATIENDCWQRLEKAVMNYKDPFRNLIVANINQQGVNLRTVILRKAESSQKELFFYTDIRSGKWRELQTDSNISCIFYNPGVRIQIRAGGKASLHHDDVVADEAWANCIVGSRKVYLAEAAPSSISGIPTSGLPQAFETGDPTLEESETGRQNFGVVVIKVAWMEWLWLNNKGHRRACFNYTAAGKFNASWLVP